MSTDLFSVAGRTAIITGASSGIGADIAKGLVKAGIKRVYIVGRREALLKEIAQSSPGVIVPLAGDVSTKEGCIKIADEFSAKETLVGVSDVSLDILVNNAGILSAEGSWAQGSSPEQIRDALLMVSDETWAQQFAINAVSIQWLSAALLPYLARAANTNNGRREGRGSIVNNTSVSGLQVNPRVQLHMYCATKTAAENITRNLATKLTSLGVRVNSIAPAGIPSEMNDPDKPDSFIARGRDSIPIGRIGNEEDAVAAVIYFSSRAGSYVSGNTLKLDGGLLVDA